MNPQHHIRHALLDRNSELRSNTTLVDEAGEVRTPWREKFAAELDAGKKQATIQSSGIHELLAAHRLYEKDRSFADAVREQLEQDEVQARYA